MFLSISNLFNKIVVSSFMGMGPYGANSVALKVGLYGLINLTILGIEIAFFPLGKSFERLAIEGSSPDLESEISGGMSTTLIWVHSTYILIFIVAFIGATKIIG